MEQTIEVLKAIAQPTRMRILLLLADHELCSCELVEMLGITQPAVSQQMNVLKRAGLVSERKEGTWVYYQLQREHLECTLQWLGWAISAPRLTRGAADWDKLDELLAEREKNCRDCTLDRKGS
ncbi:MAG: ArsR/SmtB family transcription factor [Bacillota bacterium]|jgi:ArsR family transcriptional regulator